MTVAEERECLILALRIAADAVGGLLAVLADPEVMGAERPKAVEAAAAEARARAQAIVETMNGATPTTRH